MSSFVNILVSHILLNFFIFYFFDSLKKKLNIYDYPDQKKKLHKKATPLMGGVIFLFNLILFLIKLVETRTDYCCTSIQSRLSDSSGRVGG